MALTDLTRISTSGIATGTSLSGAILHGDAHFRGTNAGINSAIFDSSANELNLKDNVKLTFGNAGTSDSQFYFDSNNLILQETSASGSMLLRGQNIRLQNTSQSNENYIECLGDNANRRVKIYQGTTTRFETTSTGAKVTGILTATSFSGPIVGNTNNASGISTFYDLRVSNNLTVEGTTTTLDTNLVGVDRIEVGANSNTVTGIAVTQSGTADIVRLYDGASQVVTVDDVGNVGLGSAIPSAKLDVVGTGIFSGLLTAENEILIKGTGTILELQAYGGPAIGLKDTNGNSFAFISNTGGTFNIQTSSNSYSNKLSIKPAGNVGIGTDNPDHNLHVHSSSGDSVISIESTGNGNHSALEFIRTSSGGNSKGAGSIYVTGNTSSSEAIMKFAVGHNVGHEHTPSMVIMGNGEVGIGTDNPTYKLHVDSGDAAIGLWKSRRSSGSYIEYAVGENGAALGYIGAGEQIISSAGADSGDFAIRSQGDLLFASGGSVERLRIASDGGVGINTDKTRNTKNVSIAGVTRDYTNSGTDLVDSGGIILQPTISLPSTGQSYPGIFWSGNTAALGRARAGILGVAASNHEATDIVFLTKNIGGGYGLYPSDERLRIASNGKVGINQSSNILTRLHVSENLAESTAIDWSNSTMSLSSKVGGNSTNNRSTLYFAPYNAANQYCPSAISCSSGNNYESTLKFFTNGHGNGTGHLGAYERLRITSTGKVGIGSIIPAATFDVAGGGQFKTNGASVKIESSPGTNFTQLQLVNTGGNFYIGRENSAGDWFSSGTGYASVLRSDGAYPLIFRVNSANRLAITSDGNITFGVQSSDTPITNAHIKHIDGGQDYWNSTKGDYRSLRYLAFFGGADNAYGMGISASELELQAQQDIGFYSGSAGSSTGRRSLRILLDNSANALTLQSNTTLNLNGTTNAPYSWARINIGRDNGTENRAIDIWGSWSAGESKSITFNHGTTVNQMVGQINCIHHSPGSSMRWGKLYHAADSSTYTLTLDSTSTSGADLTLHSGDLKVSSTTTGQHRSCLDVRQGTGRPAFNIGFADGSFYRNLGTAGPRASDGTTNSGNQYLHVRFRTVWNDYGMTMFRVTGYISYSDYTESYVGMYRYGHSSHRATPYGLIYHNQKRNTVVAAYNTTADPGYLVIVCDWNTDYMGLMFEHIGAGSNYGAMMQQDLEIIDSKRSSGTSDPGSWS